jgi:hypothetical protein
MTYVAVRLKFAALGRQPGQCSDEEFPTRERQGPFLYRLAPSDLGAARRFAKLSVGGRRNRPFDFRRGV